MTPELAWGIIGMMGAAIAALFTAILALLKRADAKHVDELTRVRDADTRSEKTIERWQQVYAESVRTEAQRTDALRELSKAVDRQTEATNRSATAEIATLEFMRQMRSGAFRAVRNEPPGQR